MYVVLSTHAWMYVPRRARLMLWLAIDGFMQYPFVLCLSLQSTVA